MSARWNRIASRLHQEITKGRILTKVEDRRYLLLMLAGEVGELANLEKRIWSGGVVSVAKMNEEIADIRITLELLANVYDMDLDKAVELKLLEIERRVEVGEYQEERKPRDVFPSNLCERCKHEERVHSWEEDGICTKCSCRKFQSLEVK